MISRMFKSSLIIYLLLSILLYFFYNAVSDLFLLKQISIFQSMSLIGLLYIAMIGLFFLSFSLVIPFYVLFKKEKDEDKNNDNLNDSSGQK